MLDLWESFTKITIAALRTLDQTQRSDLWFVTSAAMTRRKCDRFLGNGIAKSGCRNFDGHFISLCCAQFPVSTIKHWNSEHDGRCHPTGETSLAPL